MKKILIIFTLAIVLSVLLIKPVYAYDLDYNNGAITYNYAPLTRYTQDKSGYSITNPSSNVYVASISTQFNKVNHVIDATQVSRITISGRNPVFPIPFTSYMTSYSISSVNMYMNISFAESHSANYDTTSLIFDKVSTAPMSISGATMTVYIITTQSISDSAVRDNVYHVLSAYWAYFGQNGDTQAYDISNGGYDKGFEAGKEYGYQQGFEDTWDYAYDNGYDSGYDIGYFDGDADGYLRGLEAEQLDLWSALWISFTTPFTLFEIEMLPGVTIGMIALIPLVLGLIAFIFSLGGKKK